MTALLRITQHSCEPNGVVLVEYVLSSSDRFQKIIAKLDGKVVVEVQASDIGTVRLKTGTNRTVRINLEAVGGGGSDWAFSGDYDVYVPVIVADQVRPSPPPVQRRASFASIGLQNPKTPVNVGSILRAAECYGVASVAISGDRIKGHHIDSATNVSKAHRKIPVYRGDLRNLIPFGAVPVAVELIDDAVSLFDFVHPRQAFYIFGAEDVTLGRAVLDWCPHVVQIPTAMCLNLSVAVTTVLYDRAAKEHRR